MKSIYHYTKVDSFKQIVKDGNLNFRASRYSNFDNRDYEWIRKYAELAIIKMCESRKYEYDPDLLELIPYIISFCNNASSESMWKNYAGSDGVLLEINGDKVRASANNEENFDIFGDCMYLSEEDIKDRSNLIKNLDKLYNGNISQMSPKEENEDVNGENYQYDLLKCACLLKQKDYIDEKESRYIIPNYNNALWSVKSNTYFRRKNDKENEENIEFYIEVKIKKGMNVEGGVKVEINEKKYMYRIFPQETLLGVTFGPEVRDDVIKEVHHLLKDKGFDVSRISFKKLKIINTCIGPRLRRCDCSSLFK